jgi:lauroyl/myristoyl acyltransferase
MIPSETLRSGRRPRWYAHAYNRAEVYRLAAALARLPRPLRLRLAAGVGRVAQSFMPRERAAVARVLARATDASGPALGALTRELFGEFAMCFSDLVAGARYGPDGRLAHVGRVTGREHLAVMSTAVVSVTAHVGNWDVAGRMLAGATAHPTHIVVAPEEVPVLERWLRRDGRGVGFVPRGAPTLALSLMQALRRGETVGMQGDRALGNDGDVPVPFLGRPAPFPVGPFRLAAATGAPVVPAFCTMGARGDYDVEVHAPLVIPRGSEQDALRVWVSDLERLVRRRPTQWFNFFDIWAPFDGQR